MAAPRPQIVTESSASGAQVIDGSLAFRSFSESWLKGDTLSKNGNRSISTVSFWVKRNVITNNALIFGFSSDSWIYFDDNGRLTWQDESAKIMAEDPAYYLDSANSWYHVHVKMDCSQSTASQRVRLYLNGEDVTGSNGNTSEPAQWFRGKWNNAGEYGRFAITSGNPEFNGQLSQFYFIDGIALEPTEFGFKDELTNTWRPKKYDYKKPSVAKFYSPFTSVPSTDSSGNGITITDPSSGGVSAASAGANSFNISTALDFGGGNDDLLVCGSTAFDGTGTIDMSGDQYTIDFYLKADGDLANGHSPLTLYHDAGTAGGDRSFRFYMDNADLRISYEGTSNDLVKASLDTNWHHIRITNSCIYFDGTNVMEGDFRSATRGAACRVLYGGFNSVTGNAYKWKGMLGPLRIMDKDLGVPPSGGLPTTSGALGLTGTSTFGGPTSLYLPFDGSNAVAYNQFDTGINYRPIGISGSVPLDKATGGSPILNTVNGGTSAGVGVRTDSSGNYCVLALPLDSNLKDVSNTVNSGSTTKVATRTGGNAGGFGNTGLGCYYGRSYFFPGSYVNGGTGEWDGDYLNIPHSTDFNMGSGDFTLEAWVYITEHGADKTIIGKWAGGLDWQLTLAGGGSNNVFMFSMWNGSATVSAESDVNDNQWVNTWVHVAGQRKGNVLHIIVGGRLAGTAAFTGSAQDTSNAVQIGGRSDTYGFMKGYMQDARIYKGVAKYDVTSVGDIAFVPPATDPDIIADSPSGVVHSAELTKPITGSVSFMGPDCDNMTLGGSSDLAFGTGDFCVELWVYMNDISNWNHFVDYRPFGSEIVGIMIRCNDGQLRASLNTNNADSIQVAGACEARRWYHIALTRSGTSVRLFKNGKVIGTTTSSDNLQNGTDRPMIGGSGYHHKQHGMSGFISNLRMVKGSAVYTADFTPPASPLTNITNTKLLCCQSSTWASHATVSPTNTENYSAGLYLKSTTYADRGGSSCTVTNNGTVTSSSAGTNPFGIVDAASMTGTQRIDLNMGNVSGTFFQNPWTLEMFFKKSGTGSDNWFVGTSTDGSSWNTGWSIDYTSNGLTWNYNSSSSLPMYIFLEADTWYFMRVQRDPGSATYLSCEVYDSPENMVGSWRGTSTDAATHTNNVLKIGDANGNANNLGQTWMFSNVMLTAGDYGRQNVPPLVSGERVDGTSLSQQPIISGRVASSGFNPFDETTKAVMGPPSGYCSFNTLDVQRYGNNETGSGNLGFRHDPSNWLLIRADQWLSSGKWYFEAIMGDNQYPSFGLTADDYEVSPSGNHWMNENKCYGYYPYDGSLYWATNSQSWYAPTDHDSRGKTIGMALDMDAKTMRFFKDGIDLGIGYSPATTGNFADKDAVVPTFWVYDREGITTWNFGQKPFTFPPPAGFKPVCTSNLPTSANPTPNKYFTTFAYNGSSATTFRKLGIEADLVWIKSNWDNVGGWNCLDTVRGASQTVQLNTNAAQTNETGNFDSFNKEGVTVKGSANAWNGLGDKFVIYAWAAGGSKGTFNKDGNAYSTAATAGLTAGDIAPTGSSVNTKNGFSIIQYTAAGSGDRVPHGLTETPDVLFTKIVSSPSDDWSVYTDKIDGSYDYFVLNGTNAKTDSGQTIFNATTFPNVWGSGKTIINYLWHDVPGIQKFGTFTGNNDADGRFVYLGFQPAMLILKEATSTSAWTIKCNNRFENCNSNYAGNLNRVGNQMYLNTTAIDEAKSAAYGKTSFTSNGFKPRVAGQSVNSYTSYFYMAFSEQAYSNLYGAQSNAR